MSKDESKRVNPTDAQEISDEALETVAGGCQIGDSVQTTIVYPTPIKTTVVTSTIVVIDPPQEPLVPLNPLPIIE